MDLAEAERAAVTGGSGAPPSGQRMANVDQSRDPVAVISQPYIQPHPGRFIPTEQEIASCLSALGFAVSEENAQWERDDGVVLGDTHDRNFIRAPDEIVYAIDVQPKLMPGISFLAAWEKALLRSEQPVWHRPPAAPMSFPGNRISHHYGGWKRAMFCESKRTRASLSAASHFTPPVEWKRLPGKNSVSP